MSKLPVLGIIVLMLFVVSGYVSSNPTEEVAGASAPVMVVEEPLAPAAAWHPDPHVAYYAQHLASMGLAKSNH